MRAGYITGHGGNEVVTVGTRPDPVRKPGDILVRLKAATLNRVDLYMRNSGAGITHSLPMILGLDGAGLVEEVDSGERQWKKGDRVLVHPALVCQRCEHCQRGDHPLCATVRYLGEHTDGTYAEFISLPAANVFRMPVEWDFAESAALGVNHLTAWRMVFTKAQFKPWETALIFGVGGGVSLAALQLIKSIGGKAIVTSREEDKLARATALGADHAINGAKEDISKRVLEITGKRGVDVVIENIGEAVWPHAMKSVVRGGRIVTCGATSGDHPSADLRRLFIRQIQVFGSTLGSFGEMHDLIAHCEGHDVRPVIDSTYPLAEAHAALDRLDAGRQFGKIALNLE